MDGYMGFITFRGPRGFDEIIWRLSFKRFEPGSKIIGHKKGVQVLFKLRMICNNNG